MNEKFALLTHSRLENGLLSGGRSEVGMLSRLWRSLGCPGIKKRAAISGLASSPGGVEGMFLSINLPAGKIQNVSPGYIAKKIIRTCRVAEKMGAGIIGLGLLHEEALEAGAALARLIRPAVTTGKSYLVAAALEGCKMALAWLGVSLEEAEVLILGAAASPGSTCARLLARDGINYLTLADADSYRLENLARVILYEYGVACKVTSQLPRSAGCADLIIVTHRGAGYSLNLDDVKPGAIIYDFARAKGLPASPAPHRQDIAVIEGSMIEIPGKVSLPSQRHLSPQCVPAEMVEAMVLALERRYESYTLSRELRLEKVDEIMRLAQKHGFKTVGFQLGGKYFDQKRFLRIKGRLRLPGKLSPLVIAKPNPTAMP